MYPVLFEIFGYPISTFGVMMATGFWVGTWVTAVRMRELGLHPELASSMLIYVMIGGIVGAKLYFAVDTAIRQNTSIFPLLFSRDGITWYGGLFGAMLASVIGCRRHHISILTFWNIGALAAPLGHALGRVGCFLVGDDYGRPTDLPWGMAFPRGAPPTLETVHPTQLYEAAWLLLVTAFLWMRRNRSPFSLGEYLALNGVGRFVIEFWRINPKLALGLTEPQWIGLGLLVSGATGWLIFHKRRATLSDSQAT